MEHLRRTFLLSLPLALALGACDTSTDSADPSDDLALVAASEFANPSFAAANMRVSRAEGMDDVFMGVNGKMKGFGGFYFDDQGRLSIVMAPRPGNGNNDPEKAKRKLMKAMSKLDNVSHLIPSMESATPVLVDGAYDFIDLASWRSAAFTHESVRQAFTFVDLNERTNQLVIGVRNVEDVAPVRATVEGLGVPAAALVVELREPLASLQEIDGTFSRSIGAIKIEYSDPLSGGRGGCTLGFNAVRNGVRGFVTNSHCTQQDVTGQPAIGGARNTSIYQPTISSNRLLGREGSSNVYDPYPSGCAYGSECRYSDAAFIPYQSTFSSDLGRIARTLSRSTASSVELTQDSSSPYFTITGRTSYPASGLTVEKIGALSGWTSAVTQDTDFVGLVSDKPGDGATALDVVLLRQTSANIPLSQAEARSGDSGSPVFTVVGSQATLVGLFHGVSGGRPVGDSVYGRTIVFSPLGGVERDLGPLTVF